MDSKGQQCRGVTKKGARCKIISKDAYCHYHARQRGDQRGPASGPNDITIQTRFWKGKYSTRADVKPNTRGYIYVYTLRQLISGKISNENPLMVKNLPNTRERDRDRWVQYDMKCPYTLIKVGMTTQTVEHRLQQWHQKCGHQISPLSPYDSTHKKKRFFSTFLSRFKNLSLDDYLETYNEDIGGFVCNTAVSAVEKEIHLRLIERYGKGIVYCTGCMKQENQKRSSWIQKIKGEEPFLKEHNYHVEWFLVPKNELKWVYRMIDKKCLG